MAVNIINFTASFSVQATRKYNMVPIRGVKTKHTTNEPLSIVLLGTNTTPIISNKVPVCRLIIRKAHVS